MNSSRAESKARMVMNGSLNRANHECDSELVSMVVKDVSHIYDISPGSNIGKKLRMTMIQEGKYKVYHTLGAFQSSSCDKRTEI